jgi:hypothetical protein
MNLIVTVDKRFSQESVVACASRAKLPLASLAPYYYRPSQSNDFAIAFAIIPAAATDGIVRTFADLLMSQK